MLCTSIWTAVIRVVSLNFDDIEAFRPTTNTNSAGGLLYCQEMLEHEACPPAP